MSGHVPSRASCEFLQRRYKKKTNRTAVRLKDDRMIIQPG